MIIYYTTPNGYHDYRRVESVVRRIRGGTENKITFRCKACSDVRTSTVWVTGDEIPGLHVGGSHCPQGYYGR